MIKHDTLMGVFKKLGIELSTALRTQLGEYIQGRQSGDDKKFPLLKFLADIGLPAQTLGPEAQRAKEALKLLTRDELISCRDRLVELRKAIQAMKAQNTRSATKDPIDLFLNQSSV